MAFWCIDLLRVVFYSLLITFASCHPGLPCDAATLAARDGSHDTHNWHKVMQTLKGIDSRIGIPWAALPDLQFDMPLILEMAPYNLTIVRNEVSKSPENEFIEVDDRQLMALRHGGERRAFSGASGRKVVCSQFWQICGLKELRWQCQEADLEGPHYAYGTRTPS